MAAETTNSNYYKYRLATKNINFSTDTFKMLLMPVGFAWSEDTHKTYSDVSAEQIAGTFGYTTGGMAMTLKDPVTEGGAIDTTADTVTVNWNDVTVTANGGAITTFIGVIVYDETDGTVIFYTDLGTEVTLTDGLSFIANTISVQIA